MYLGDLIEFDETKKVLTKLNDKQNVEKLPTKKAA